MVVNVNDVGIEEVWRHVVFHVLLNLLGLLLFNDHFVTHDGQHVDLRSLTSFVHWLLPLCGQTEIGRIGDESSLPLFRLEWVGLQLLCQNGGHGDRGRFLGGLHGGQLLYGHVAKSVHEGSVHCREELDEFIAKHGCAPVDVNELLDVYVAAGCVPHDTAMGHLDGQDPGQLEVVYIIRHLELDNAFSNLF